MYSAFAESASQGFSFLLLLASAGFASPPQKTPEFVPGSWTLGTFARHADLCLAYPGLFTLQTHWIAKNKDKHNIRYVLGLGDITDRTPTRVAARPGGLRRVGRPGSLRARAPATTTTSRTATWFPARPA